MEIVSSRLPRSRSKNRDLGNSASPATYMNTSELLHRKEYKWRDEISETEPVRLTGLISRGPKISLKQCRMEDITLSNLGRNLWYVNLYSCMHLQGECCDASKT